MKVAELKVGDIVKLKLTDRFDKLDYGVDEVVFKIVKIRGYVFGKILNGSKAGNQYDFAFHITDKDRFSIIDENEGLIQYGL
jgi:hypothetical protein